MNLLGQRHLQLSQEAVHKTTKVSKTKTDANTNTGAKARETIFKPDDQHITIYASEDENTWLLHGHIYVDIGADGTLTIKRLLRWDYSDPMRVIYE